MPRLDTHGYLERLGIADPGEPSVAGLRALHAAHVERVALGVHDRSAQAPQPAGDLVEFHASLLVTPFNSQP